MPSIVVCPGCDLAHRRDDKPSDDRLRCVRCRSALQLPNKARIETAIALAVCALIFLILSNAYPLVVIHANGSAREATLFGAAFQMYDQGYDSLSALVFLTTVVAPFLQIAALLYILTPLWRKRRARGQNLLFRLLTEVRPWTFVEVFLLGTVVALVRLSAYAQIVPGIALGSCVLLMLTLSALTSITSPEQFWRWVDASHA